MRLRFKATHVVLAMLCIMYFITYVDRVNIGTAASEIQKELALSNTQLGLVFSAFAYPYLLFQVIGGWVGDRFGPRKTLFWCGMIWAASTIMTGFVTGLLTLFIARVALGFGEGATFPTATRAMQYWTPANRRGFAQGLTHAFARLGNAVTPPLIATLMVWFTWRGSFIALGLVSLLWGVVWVWYFRNEPRDHVAITETELASLPPRPLNMRPQVPWGPLLRRMWPVPMDIAPKYSGTASGLMNTGSALAAIVSPLVAGYVIDVTGNWYLPFLMSMGLLLLGGFAAFLMHPEKPFEEAGATPLGQPVAAR